MLHQIVKDTQRELAQRGWLVLLDHLSNQRGNLAKD
jgi:hypothetical protein